MAKKPKKKPSYEEQKYGSWVCGHSVTHKAILILFISLLTTRTQAAGPVQFEVPSDKYMHATTMYGLTRYTEEEYNWTWFQSFLFINAIGILKEATDPQFDKADIAANNAGWLLAHLTLRFEF